MATETAASAASIIARMAAKTPKKAGAAKKEAVNNDALNAAIDQWIEADKEVDKWTGVRTTVQQQIVGFAKSARLDACRNAGKVESSILVNGRLNFSQKCQYSKIGTEHQAELDKAFGKDAKHYFKLRTDLSLTEDAANDPAVLEKLIDALGEDEFARVFTAKQHLEVTEIFHGDFTLKEAVEKKAQPLIDMEVIKPYSPTLGLPKGKK